MKRKGLLALVSTLAWGAPAVASAYTPFHFQSDTWWSSFVSDAGSQASMWLGDIGALPVTIVGIGLVLMLVAGIVALIRG